MNLNVVAAVNGTGYGVVGLNVLKSLAALGVEVAFFPRPVGGPEPSLDLAEVALIMRCVRRQRTFDMTAPCLRISGEDDMTLFAGRGPRGGLAFFDTTGLTDVEVRHLGGLDVLFVASEWGRDIAGAHGLDRASVVVAPLGVDRTTFSESERPVGGPTVFLHVGAWQYRKGQDALLDAFGRAFRPGADVELRLLSGNPWSGEGEPGWVAACRESPMAAHIRIVSRVGGNREIADMMRTADCGVFPARGEAWNLELLEMMSCGRLVIATDFAGHTEYADHENALLIQIDELEPAADPVWNTVFTERKTGEWAHLGESQVDQLVEHLRAVHARKQSGETLRNDAGIETAKRFSWEHTARCILGGFA
jgi:glycosyltransferase involved in cell wall biosynthesis